MTVIDLFSGLGGFSLAARWAGMETVAFCELDPFCRELLALRFSGVPIHGDIRTFGATADMFPVCECCGEEPWCEEHRQHWGECKCIGCMSEELSDVDIITAGFPCQDASIAARGRGIDGERTGLWFETARIIELVRPRWVVLENVPRLRRVGLDAVLEGLAALRYDAEWACLTASAFGAPIRRERLWLVARTIPEPECPRLEGHVGSILARAFEGRYVPDAPGPDWGDPTPRVCRGSDGIPNRVDRLKALGNAIVPHVAFSILCAIRDASS